MGRTHRPAMSSCAAVFEQRGDAWVSPRQGLEDFGRNLQTENPDLDQFTHAKKALPRFDRGPETPIQPHSETPSYQQRMTNVLAKMHSGMQEHNHITVKDRPVQRLPNRKRNASAGYSVYVRMKDGTETEVDKTTEANAMKFLAFKRKQDRVEAVEVWSYESGEMLKKFERRPRAK